MRKCKHCGADIHMIYTQGGNWMPLNGHPTRFVPDDKGPLTLYSIKTHTSVKGRAPGAGDTYCYEGYEPHFGYCEGYEKKRAQMRGKAKPGDQPACEQASFL